MTRRLFIDALTAIAAFGALLGVLLGVLLPALSVPVCAAEAGQSPTVKGYRDLLTGILPGPGVYVREDLYFYSGSERSAIPQGRLDVSLRTASSILSATLVTPYEILGGTYAFAIRGGLTDASASRTVTTPRAALSTSGHLASTNDLVLTPLVLGWHAGRFHWNFAASAWLPVGDYDKSRLVNTGRNSLSWAPQLGVTYLDPQSGWEASAAAFYLISTENTATHYRSGNVAHLDFVLARSLSPQFKLGLAGYLVRQTTDDSGLGAIFGGRRLQVNGLGPTVAWTLAMNDVPVTLVAKYYREFSAQNTTQGNAGSVSARVRF